MNKRQNAAAYNIANASTPGFKPIRFQDEVDGIRLYGDTSMYKMSMWTMKWLNQQRFA